MGAMPSRQHEEIRNLISPPATGSVNVHQVQGPTIGADPDYERFLAAGIPDHSRQMDRAMANARENRLRFNGNSNPQFADFYNEGVRANDARQGVQGVSQAGVDALSYPGGVAFATTVKPIIHATAPVRALTAGASRVGRIPGVSHLHRGLTRIDPTFTRLATTDHGRMIGLMGDRMLGATVLHPGSYVPVAGGTGLARRLGVLPGWSRLAAPVSNLASTGTPALFGVMEAGSPTRDQRTNIFYQPQSR